MENALYVGLSRQVALQQRMNVLSNNIANVNTPGYRADKMLFEEYIVSEKLHKDNNKDDISMVLDYGQYKDTAAGTMQQTGNPLDVALSGPAFMMVETAEGTKYTRAGNFAMNNEGLLVTPSGNPVLDNGQGRITIPEGTKDITITKDGSVVTDQGSVGQIGMVEFGNVQNLSSTGDGYYVTTNGEAPAPAQNTIMQQGMVEGSNVKAVLEMTDLIEVSRAFQTMQRALQNEHDRQRSAIQKLTEK